MVISGGEADYSYSYRDLHRPWSVCIQSQQLRSQCRPFFPTVIQNTQTFFYLEVHSASVSVLFSLAQSITPLRHCLLRFCSLSSTDATIHVQIRILPFPCTHPPSHIVTMHLCFRLEMYISSNVISNCCLWTHISMSPCLEEMSSKLMDIDYAQPQKVLQIYAEQAWGAKGKMSVFSIDVLGTVERWEMCKGSQCWPVLQDVIHIWSGDKHCMEWKHTLPLVSPKSTSSSMSQRGPGDTQPCAILEAMTSASGRGSYCGNMNVFSIGESSREGQKDPGAEPSPLFFLHPSGNESLAKYVRNPIHWMWVYLVCESYVSPTHTHTQTERGTLGSRNQPAQVHHGVLSLQARQPCLIQCDLSVVSTCQVKTVQLTCVWDLVLARFISRLWARNREPMGLLLCFTFSSFTLCASQFQWKQCGTMVHALWAAPLFQYWQSLLL